MDLHDYKDVAENYDRYLEVMYGQEKDRHENFVPCGARHHGGWHGPFRGNVQGGAG